MISLETMVEAIQFATASFAKNEAKWYEFRNYKDVKSCIYEGIYFVLDSTRNSVSCYFGYLGTKVGEVLGLEQIATDAEITCFGAGKHLKKENRRLSFCAKWRQNVRRIRKEKVEDVVGAFQYANERFEDDHVNEYIEKQDEDYFNAYVLIGMYITISAISNYLTVFLGEDEMSILLGFKPLADKIWKSFSERNKQICAKYLCPLQKNE